jgi:hypothetical protein
MPVRELWRHKLLTSKQYPLGGAAVSQSPAPIIVELTQYAQEDFFSRVNVRLTGTINYGGGGAAGTPTGKDNPEGLLVSAQLQTQPQVAGVVPINQLSARGILYDSTFRRRFLIKAAPIADAAAGSVAIDQEYELYFKRPNSRKGVEYAFPIPNFQSALLTLSFGGREQLFSGGTNTWDLAGLTVQIWADSDFLVQSAQLHSHELFEQTYPINASQVDFPIDTLPSGYMYSDLMFLSEEANVLANGIINNISIEGGGRQWLYQGESNAAHLQRAIVAGQLVTDPNFDTTGIYVIPQRDGMYSRSIDALQAPIIIRLNVTAGAATVVRLVGRRVVPGSIRNQTAPPAANKGVAAKGRGPSTKRPMA